MSDEKRFCELPRFPDGYVLKTRRLNLRPLCEKDIDSLRPSVNNPHFSTFVSGEPHKNHQEGLDLLQSLVKVQRSGNEFHWGLYHDKALVGLISLINVRRTLGSVTWNRAELTCWTGATPLERDYAMEASHTIIYFAFEALGFHKITMYNVIDNSSSIPIPAQLGFRPVGIEHEEFSKEGKWHDLQHYEMLHHEFNAIQMPYHTVVPETEYIEPKKDTQL